MNPTSDNAEVETILFKGEKLEVDERDGLLRQHPDDLDPKAIGPLTPEVMSRQATINVGTIGHVAHGKSTVVKALSGVKTTKYKSEMERNITIKLGYANAKIYKAVEPRTKRPDCYVSRGSETADLFDYNGKKYQLERHVSFVDCPGHDILMATMLNGAAVMDCALLLVAANETCPQPQTSEHLAAVEIMKLDNIIILQNKIDLINPNQASAQCEQIRNFIKGHVGPRSPIIPISAQLKLNIDVICEYLCTHVPVPKRRFDADSQLIVIRSFDVNKPGSEPDQLLGGVAGGTLQQGILKVGQKIEVRPGIIRKTDSELRCEPIFSTITSLFAEKNELEYAVPGGLIGVGTKIDPFLTRADRLVGNLLGAVDRLPKIYTKLQIKYHLMKTLLGVKQETGTKKRAKVKPLQVKETLMVNIGTTGTGGKVERVKGSDVALLTLLNPVCTEIDAKLAISRRVDKSWRLIGWGKVTKGQESKLV